MLASAFPPALYRRCNNCRSCWKYAFGRISSDGYRDRPNVPYPICAFIEISLRPVISVSCNIRTGVPGGGVRPIIERRVGNCSNGQVTTNAWHTCAGRSKSWACARWDTTHENRTRSTRRQDAWRAATQLPALWERRGTMKLERRSGTHVSFGSHRGRL